MPNEQVDTKVPAPQAPKTSWFWMKNTSGKPDAALTLMVMSFLLVTSAYVASVVGTLSVGGVMFSFSAFDVTYATAITVPLMGLYFGRRWTDAKANANTPPPVVDEGGY
jgi:hypothetical protein